MTSIATCRQRGSIRTGQIATGTETGTRSGIAQRMIGEKVVVILLFVGTPLSAAIVALQLLDVAVESVSAQETE